MKRYWIGFKESWVHALLIENIPTEITEVEIVEKVKKYGEINFVKEQDLVTERWQYTHTKAKDWSEL